MLSIPSANQTRQETTGTGFEEAVKSVVRAIEKAKNEGRLDCSFNPSLYRCIDVDGASWCINYYDAVKQEFQKNGYAFRPTGYIGGVWQRTEHICW